MSTERLLLAMDQRFKVLKGGAEDVLDHQKSLRKLIAWSYDLLDESEQRLWRRLSVFPDGCGIDSAQQVCASDDEYIMEVDIEPLVDKSLVNIQFNSNSAVSRVSMLESLREYAHEKLIDSSEFNLIQGRFCEWCLRIGFPDTGTAIGPTFEVLKRIDIEYNNVCAALEYCLSERRAETALSLSSSLYYYWFDRGLFSEGISWLQKALDVDDGIVTTSRGDVLTSLSGLLRQQNRLSDALGPAGEALEIYSKLKNDKKRAKVLCELGAISARLGDLDSAANYLDECLDLAQAEQMVDRSMSVFLSTRGVVEHLKGDLVAAKALYVEGLKIGRGVGDKDSTATALLNLGEIVEAEGNTHEAYEHYRDSLKLYGDLGHKLAIAYCAEVIAGLEVRANSHSSEAAFLFGAAEAIREELEAPVESFNTERVEDDKRRTREAMDEDDYLAAWEAGRQLGVDGVLRHLLGDIST
jgi:non-specific serine/threonine protein kinase